MAHSKSLVLLLALAIACASPAAHDERDHSSDAAQVADDAGDAPDAADADAGEPVDAGADAGAPDAALDAGDALDAGALPDCTELTQGPGDYEWELLHRHVRRTFRVHVPRSYDRSRFTPVVLNFHGLNSNSAEQERFAKIVEVSDEEGFIAVGPNGVNASELGTFSLTPAERGWNAGRCCSAAQRENVDDVGFVELVLELLEQRLCVDQRRIYSTGLSNGGFLSHRLACELSDRIAAIAPVAGSNATTSCLPSRAVPVMHFHGDADLIVPYVGGAVSDSVRRTIDDWRARNGCTGPKTITYQRGDSTCETYGACRDGAEVTLCTVAGGGHTWPGGEVPILLGRTTQDLDATREMWKFFEAHPIP